MKLPLLVVGGPTASGKTGLSVALAKALKGEVICADSMQVYRGMEIGTAAPTPKEQDGVPHHLFGFLEPEEGFSVADYLGLADKSIREVAGRGKLPILCGGTGLYISSLIDGVAFDPAMGESAELRAQLRALAEEKGPGYLWEVLNGCDPELAATLHPNNLGRVIRAIEVYRASGVPMSEWQRRSKGGESPYRVFYLALNYTERARLYERIERRAEQMLEDGLLDEVRGMLEKNLSGTASQAIGYKEFSAYLKGEQTLAQAVETLKQQTRRYAKRQLTWLRRDERIHWLAPDAFEGELALAEHALGLVRAWLKETS